MFIENLIAQWQESVFNKTQRDSVLFYYSFFLGRITGVNYPSVFSRIVCRWWNILYLVIHMQMNCAIIKAEWIDWWYVLIKLIVVWKEGKLWISDYWVIWRDGIFFVVNKMRRLLLLHLVTYHKHLNLLHDYVHWCWLFQILGLAVVSICLLVLFLQNDLPGVFHYSEEVSFISKRSS